MTTRTARTLASRNRASYVRRLALASLVMATTASCGAALKANSEAPSVTLRPPPVVLTTLTTVAAPATAAPAATTSCVITGTTGTGWTAATSYKFTVDATNTYALLVTSFDVSFFTGTSADGSDNETADDVTAGLLKPSSSLSWNVAKSSGGSVGDTCVVQSVGVTAPGGIAETLHNSVQP
jgi:hypothetical protein